MLDYQQRVIAEKEELDGRIARLRAFLMVVRVAYLSDSAKALLVEQMGIMEKYSDVLRRRIEEF